MRILMLSQSYPPVMGGEQQHVHDLSIELARRGHVVAVATFGQPGLPEFELLQGVRIYRIQGLFQRAAFLFSSPERRPSPPMPDPEALWSLRRIIRRERPQIVHAHNWLLHSFLPLKKWSGARLVVTLHNYNLRCANLAMMYRGSLCSGPGPVKCVDCAIDHYGALKGIPTVLANWLTAPAERAAVDLFLPVSRAVAAGCGLLGSRLPYRILPNWVPTDMELGPPPEDTLPFLARLPSEDYLLYVGALSRHKGVDVLLRAYAGLADVPPLVLIGHPTAQYPLSQADLPGNAHLLTTWPHRAVIHAWPRAIAGLLPSVWPETFGIVVLEAMASGKPVIASNIGALPDVVTDGQNGLLVRPADADQLRNAIGRLLADVAMRERMGEQARRTAAEFRAEVVVTRIEEAYRDVFIQTPGSRLTPGESGRPGVDRVWPHREAQRGDEQCTHAERRPSTEGEPGGSVGE